MPSAWTRRRRRARAGCCGGRPDPAAAPTGQRQQQHPEARDRGDRLRRHGAELARGDDLALDRTCGELPELASAPLAVAAGDLEPLLPCLLARCVSECHVWEATGVAGDDPYVTPQRGWRMWWTKRRWYERTHRLRNRWRINRHAARGGFYVRHPIEGEVLEALDDGRLTIGEGTLLEPGCWITLGPEARIAIGRGCFLNRETMLAAHESIEIGDHVMFANHCFVGDADHRYDDPELPITWQGFVARGAGPDRLQQLARQGRRRHRRRRDRRALRDRRQLRRHPRHAAVDDLGRARRRR